MQLRTHYPARLSFRIEGEIKAFPDKQKLNKSVTTKSTLQEILSRTLGKKKQQKQRKTSSETPTLQVTQWH